MNEELHTQNDSSPSALPEVLWKWRTPPGQATRAATGFWQCSLVERQLCLDGRCAALLGYAEAQPRSFGLDEWKKRLHPDEGDSSGCRYKLMFEQPMMGDVLEDVFRVRRENGDYVRLQMYGSVIGRDAEGRALRLVGSMRNPELADPDSVEAVESGASDSGRLLFAINAAGDGLWDWDAQNNSVYYSPRYLSMLGYTMEEFPGNLDGWTKKIHPEDWDKIVPPQLQIVESPRFGDTFECTYRIMRKDGSWAWILGRGYVTHRDAAGRATRLVGLHTNITTVQNGREKLEELVKNDALTGLRSRAFCDLEIDRIDKTGLRPVSVISCDIDGLKLVNDYLGHAEGDKLLIRTAMLLRRPLRASDCVARMGGDEFLILLPGCPGDKGKEILAEIQKELMRNNASTGEIPVLVSFGIATTEQPDVPVSKVLLAADRKMLHGKMAHRIAAHRYIKVWIERTKHIAVSLEDNRYAG